MAGKAVGVLLAVAAAALLAAAVRAADDDDKTQPWKCFRSCAKGCHHHNHDNDSAATTVAADFFFPSSVSSVSAECKSGCQDDACIKDLPAISSRQCAVASCLSHPHHSRKKTACFKDCCDKCFGNSPPTPGPPAPGPPAPGPPEPPPGPPTPEPGPTPPSPPN